MTCNCAPDEVVIHRDGRETGKSVSLVADALHYAFITQGGLALIAAPFQGHLDTLIEELDFQVESSEPLAASVARNRYGNQKIVRKPYYRIEFTNGSVLHFRPAGAYGEAFRSLHVNRLYVDEAAWIPEKAWKALRMCLLPGGRMRVYSTPNGLHDTTYFRLTQNPNYRQFHWPSWIHP
ncbi:MAG: hypothetical protein HY897_03450, partial [Deltaproteobacteria bacterium]|nr:hypothetical protein [Deltaproteobacteria bacterium]